MLKMQFESREPTLVEGVITLVLVWGLVSVVRLITWPGYVETTTSGWEVEEMRPAPMEVMDSDTFLVVSSFGWP